MEKIKITLQKIIYGAVFCLGLPLLLVVWAQHTESSMQIPVPQFPYWGLILALSGLALMLWAMFGLWKLGHGLPMNAFPPQNYVTHGAYRLFRHPIYTGAVLISFGLSLYFDSSSGFWLVSPLFVLFIAAYVLGFEREIIEKHFQNQPEQHRTWFDLPSNSLQALNLQQKSSLLLCRQNKR